MITNRAVSNGGKTGFHLSPGTGQHGTETAKALQGEILHAYAQLSHSWLARVQLEAALWAEWGNKVAASRSSPEIPDTQRKRLSHEVQTTVDDG